jgi:twitching motility protein PilT
VTSMMPWLEALVAAKGLTCASRWGRRRACGWTGGWSSSEVLHADKLGMVNQREVRVDTDDLTIAMRAAMRQDPDVILVGEIRDAETLKNALAAAETGHLVRRAGDGGRVAVLEVMVNTGRTAEAISDPERTGDLLAIMAESGFYGMQTFDQHLIGLYRDGVIELEDALGVATNPHDLQVALRNQGLVA